MTNYNLRTTGDEIIYIEHAYLVANRITFVYKRSDRILGTRLA